MGASKNEHRLGKGVTGVPQRALDADDCEHSHGFDDI